MQGFSRENRAKVPVLACVAFFGYQPTVVILTRTLKSNFLVAITLSNAREKGHEISDVMDSSKSNRRTQMKA